MNLLSLFKPVRTFIFDIDGVITCSMLQLLPSGEWARSMNIKDRYALQYAVNKKYRVTILSESKSTTVIPQLRDLGIQEIFTGIEDKKKFLEEYIPQNELYSPEILYMGDDIPDYEAMQLTGLPSCPSDAAPEIKRVCKYISPYSGGAGCVRDVIEKVMKLNEHWLSS
jgi:3-deoxy-D-manno-octulosonate 8-phosphate phosphatase (KDO 8-P phosphatase)